MEKKKKERLASLSISLKKLEVVKLRQKGMSKAEIDRKPGPIKGGITSTRALG